MTEAEIKAFAQQHAPTLAAPIAALCAKVIEKGLRGILEQSVIERIATPAPSEAVKGVSTAEPTKIDWKSEYDGAQKVLTEIRTALNASGYWPLGMDLVASIRGLIAATPAVAVQAEPVRDRLIELIDQHLTSMYACGRAWEAWNVGTMSQDDFTPAQDTDFAADLADAILSAHPKPAAPATADEAVSDEAIETILFGVLHTGEEGPPGQVPYWREWLQEIGLPCARAILALRSGASAQPAGGALKEAFEEGFYSAQTYNDVLVNTSDAAWQESHTRAGTAQPAKEQPHDR